MTRDPDTSNSAATARCVTLDYGTTPSRLAEIEARVLLMGDGWWAQPTYDMVNWPQIASPEVISDALGGGGEFTTLGAYCPPR